MAESGGGFDASGRGSARRRQVLRALAGGVGAGFTLPGLALATETHRHVQEQARLEEAADRAASSGAFPGVLDAHQRETLASLAEAIVPGSEKADVAAFLDRLVAVDTPANQRDFLAALGAIDGEAVARFGRPWKGLDAAQRSELLTALSTSPPSLEVRYVLPVPPREPAPPPTVRDRFDLLKVKIAVAYYTSEPGLRELGFTGNPIHERFPGCPHPEGHP